MTVQELLSDETKWVQGRGAEDANGNEVAYNSPEAVKRCILGAMAHCYEGEAAEIKCAAFRLYTALQKLFGQELLVPWHDAPSTTFEMVQQLISYANV